MNHEPIEDEMPAEIDFSKGVHGLHHIPSDAKVLMPASHRENCVGVFLRQSGAAGR